MSSEVDNNIDNDYYLKISELCKQYYNEETQRELSIINQANFCVVIISFLFTSVLVMIQILISIDISINDNIFILPIIIIVLLIISLALALLSSHRYKYKGFPEVKNIIETKNKCKNMTEFNSSILKLYDEIIQSIVLKNNRRVKWLRLSQIGLYISIILIIFEIFIVIRRLV